MTGEIDSIVEHRDATPEILKIPKSIRASTFSTLPALFESLTRIRNENAQREYYLTDVIGIQVGHRQKVGASRFHPPRRFSASIRVRN